MPKVVGSTINSCADLRRVSDIGRDEPRSWPELVGELEAVRAGKIQDGRSTATTDKHTRDTRAESRRTTGNQAYRRLNSHQQRPIARIEIMPGSTRRRS
jgi:hypothetical protein